MALKLLDHPRELSVAAIASPHPDRDRKSATTYSQGGPYGIKRLVPQAFFKEWSCAGNAFSSCGLFVQQVFAAAAYSLSRMLFNRMGVGVMTLLLTAVAIARADGLAPGVASHEEVLLES